MANMAESRPGALDSLQELSGDQNPSYSKKKGAFRNKVWRKQSAVFRKGS